MQNLENLISQIPEYARDVKINLQTILNAENQQLTAKQIFGSALASAYATKEKNLIQVLENETKNILLPEEIRAAKIAATLMAMNNIYYRFVMLPNFQ